ncbi:hypothetical protein MUP01_10910 [Candidatus Bathyarchaeota archaeon]|nr:hypothetical protein [Candidatus Bathyarchaeota archaeon]
MKRYATAKQIDELTKTVRILTEGILKVAQWQAYQSMKQNPYIIPQKIREEILAQTKTSDPLLYFLFKELFLQNPPICLSSKA